MPAKTAKSSKAKAPVKRKRATTVNFKKDEKVDSIVEEIKKGLEEDTEPAEDLEKEIAETIEKKKSEAEKEKSDLAVEAPFEAETEAKEEKEKQVESEVAEEKDEEQEKSEEPEEKDTEEPRESVEEKKEEEKEEEPLTPAKEEDPFPPFEEEKKKRSLKWPFIYLVLFVAGMATGFVIFDQLSSRSDFKFPSLTAPTPTPTEAPSPTPTPEQIDLSQYPIRLENGSGTGGEAGRLQELLEKDEFTIESIGNADKSTYTETVIKAKNGTNAEFLKKLRSALEKTYKVAKDVETLDADDKIDAVVLIGSEKAEE